MNGASQVDAWVAKLRRLPQAVNAETLAPVVAEELIRTASAGTTPDGAAWKPTVDGRRALKGVAGKIRVVPVGTQVIATLLGPDAIHNSGTKKDPVRQVLPKRLSPGLVAKLKRVASKAFNKLFGGR